MREELILLSRRKLEIDYVLENNQMKDFIDHNVKNLDFEKVYAEVPQTSEVVFNEVNGRLEVIDEKGELIFEEINNTNNANTGGQNIRSSNNKPVLSKIHGSVMRGGSENKLVTPIKPDLFSSINKGTSNSRNFNNFDTYTDLGQRQSQPPISSFSKYPPQKPKPKPKLKEGKEKDTLANRKKSLFAMMREVRNSNSNFDSKDSNSSYNTGG